MTTPLCACGRPSPSAVLCGACAKELSAALASAAAIAADLDDAVARLTVRGRGGGARRVPESQPPADLDAMEAAAGLRNCLTGWVRVVIELEPKWQFPPDTVFGMAVWLAGRQRWWRQHEAAADMHRDVLAAVARAMAVVDLPPERVPAGTCEACGAPLLAELGADEVRCACGTLAVALREKRRSRAEAADVLGSPAELAATLATLGITVSPGTIRVWASRGRLTARPGGVYAMSDVIHLAAR